MTVGEPLRYAWRHGARSPWIQALAPISKISDVLSAFPTSDWEAQLRSFKKQYRLKWLNLMDQKPQSCTPNTFQDMTSQTYLIFSSKSPRKSSSRPHRNGRHFEENYLLFKNMYGEGYKHGKRNKTMRVFGSTLFRSAAIQSRDVYGHRQGRAGGCGRALLKCLRKLLPPLMLLISF